MLLQKNLFCERARHSTATKNTSTIMAPSGQFQRTRCPGSRPPGCCHWPSVNGSAHLTVLLFNALPGQIETAIEIAYAEHQGVLNYVLKNLAKAPMAAV